MPTTADPAERLRRALLETARARRTINYRGPDRDPQAAAAHAAELRGRLGHLGRLSRRRRSDDRA